jgi:hypothetical protein
MSLKEITFPESLTAIYYQAFEKSALTDITITGPVIQFLDETAFLDVNATVHYPGNDTTWHEAHRKNYGGNLTWESYYKEVTQIAEGTCGENLTWKLTSDGILTVSGTGAMTDYKKTYVSSYGYNLDMPWLSYSSRIGKIVVEDGVTSIGNYAFSHMSYLREVEIPESVTSIGAYAFCEDNELLYVDLPDTVTAIGISTFYNCNSLTGVDIPNTVTVIGSDAFYNCTNLTKIRCLSPSRILAPVHSTTAAAFSASRFPGASVKLRVVHSMAVLL